MKTDLNIYIKTEKNNEQSIKYLTGVNTDYGVLLEYPKKKVLYLTPLEEKPEGNFIVKTLNFEKLFKDIKKSEAKIIGMQFSDISKKVFDIFKKNLKGIKIIDITKDASKKRNIKTEKEINTIKKAVEITEEILKNTFRNFKKFKTENDVEEFLRISCIKKGVKVSFDPIVASGIHSSNPHYFPKPNSKLRKGFCIIDFGIVFKGYCSDMTRTIYLGKPNKKDIEEYNKVKEELLRLEKELKEGEKAKCTFKMIHALGHGIGLDVHEGPHLHIEKLQNKNVIALEPAIYNKKYGIRIEDNYVVRKNKIVRLGCSSRDLKII